MDNLNIVRNSRIDGISNRENKRVYACMGMCVGIYALCCACALVFICLVCVYVRVGDLQ